MEKNGARFHVAAFIFHASGGDLRRLAREGGRGETREQFMEEERETFFHVGVLTPLPRPQPPPVPSLEWSVTPLTPVQCSEGVRGQAQSTPSGFAK